MNILEEPFIFIADSSAINMKGGRKGFCQNFKKMSRSRAEKCNCVCHYDLFLFSNCSDLFRGENKDYRFRSL